MEKTLTFVKTKFIKKQEKIYEYTDKRLRKEQIVYSATEPKLIYVPKQIMREHYSHVLYLPFIEPMIKELCEGGIVLRIYEAENIIKTMVDITGPTDPSMGNPHQLRRYFSDDKLETALAKNRPVENVIHRSTSLEEAKKEIQRFNNFIDWSTLCTK